MDCGQCGQLGQHVPQHVDLGSGPKIDPVLTQRHFMVVLHVLGQHMMLNCATLKDVQVMTV